MPGNPIRTHRPIRRRLAGALLATAALAGCAAPDLGPRPQLAPPASLASQRALSLGPVGDAWPSDRWWVQYDDPQLDALVDEALAHSPSVAEAAARLRIARGVVTRAGAASAPQLDVSGQAGFKKQSYNNGIPPQFVPRGWKSFGSLALGGDFDLDLWGRRKAELAAATSDALAAEVDARAAALALSSDVVEAYATLGVLYQRRDLLETQVKARDASLDLYTRRYRGGLDSKLPQQRADADATAIAGELEANAEQIALERNILAALVGAGPDRGLAIQRPTATGPFARIPVPADAGIALAGRRADIVAARLRVEAEGKRIDAARAAFLPDISLSGLVGFMSLGLSHLFDAGSDYGDAHAALSLPLFDGGTRRGNLEQSRGNYDLAVAGYNATVVDALKDVADALASRTSVEQQAAEANRAAAAAGEAVRLADARFRGGLGTYLDVLEAQDAAVTAERKALDTRARLVLLDIQLVRALGGGFAGENATPNGNAP